MNYNSFLINYIMSNLRDTNIFLDNTRFAKCCNVICIVIASILLLALLSGGIFFIYRSTKYYSCSPWPDRYNDDWMCGNKDENIIATFNCSSHPCYCLSRYAELHCLSKLNDSPFVAQLLWGVVMLIFGIVVLLFLAAFISKHCRIDQGRPDIQEAQTERL